jgi:hypothetical protein
MYGWVIHTVFMKVNLYFVPKVKINFHEHIYSYSHYELGSALEELSLSVLCQLYNEIMIM